MDGMWHWVSCLEKKPKWRTVEDLDIILSKMKTMKVFESYPVRVLLDLARCALYDTFLDKHVLYKPGEEGDHWYTVVSGALEMFDVDPVNSAKTSICVLQEGDSFGENVIFGTCRQTMVVTRNYCELLYVEAADIQAIYEANHGVMERLLRGASLEPDSLATLVEGEEVDGRRESMAESDLVVAGMTLLQLISDHFSELFKDHQVNMFTYKQSCSGRRMVDWVIAQSSAMRARPQVVQMWQAMLTQGLLQHVHQEHPFRDDPHLLYRMAPRDFRPRPRSESMPPSRLQSLFPFLRTDSEAMQRMSNGRPRSSSSVVSSPRNSRSSLTSLLDECFDTITQLGPEALIYATLMKEPSERSEEDLELIFEELLHLRALQHLSNAVKREIAACVRLEHFKKAGKFLFHQGDKGDSWYIILRGSVNISIRGKGVVCTLHEGDEFGKLALVNEGVRSSSVQTREDGCHFLCIARVDFRRILLSVESATMRLVEHGRPVMMLERATLGRYHVVKGTPDKMMDHLVEADSGDESFAEDFFLTYPVYLTIEQLCEGLRLRFHQMPVKGGRGGAGGGGGGGGGKNSAGDEASLRKARVAQVLSEWIVTAGSDLVKNAIFLALFTEVQDLLLKAGLGAESGRLNTTLSDNMRTSAPSYNSPSSILSISKPRKASAASEPDIRMGINTVPPLQPQDKLPLRVHTAQHTCCRLQARLDATAASIAEEACGKLKLASEDFDLCEVKSSGERVLVRPADVSVLGGLSVNGRLFLVPKSCTDRSLEPLSDQNQNPLPSFPEKEGSRELAAHLCLYDYNLLTNIDQMEFIYSAFGRHKFGKITANLDLLIRRFNEVEYWVVTELCAESDLSRRCALLKKFIKIAGYCKSFNNLNSFLAIVVGLMNGSVTRLHQTWRELPLRLKRRFKSFESLTDPSRNHKVLRAYQSKLIPPIVPFMPLVLKDAYFLQEGNETFVDGLVNFEKMRLVASRVRSMNKFRSGSLPAEVRALCNKNTALQQYMRNLRVVDNQQLLAQMSHRVEATQLRPLSSAT